MAQKYWHFCQHHIVTNVDIISLVMLRFFVLCVQRVLGDSVQIRSTLQGFGSVLKDMSQVCDTEQLQAQLLEADAQVADVQESFTAPLSQLEHAAAVSCPETAPEPPPLGRSRG